MARNEKVKFSTYRLNLSNNTVPVGVGFEIPNPAGSGKALKLRRFNVRAGTASICTIKRNSAAASGGTSTAGTVVGSVSGDVSVVTAAKIYTVAPTPGSAVDTPASFYLSTNPQESQIADEEAEPINIKPGEVASFEFSVSAALTGYIQWTEEAV